MNLSSNLKKRVITGGILGLIVILAIFLLPRFEFILFCGLLLLLAGWEWCRLIGLSRPLEQIIFLLLLLILFFSFNVYLKILPFIFAVFWWLTAVYLVCQYPKKTTALLQNKYLLAGMGMIVLVPCMLGINSIREVGPLYLLFCFFLVWAMDTGAFFVGRRWGKRKLAPAVSPGKTIAGLWGGLIFTLITAVIELLILQVPAQKWWAWLSLAIIVAVASVIGDLFESMMKRHAGVKDSSNLLPGHGGVLDRIDSLTCAIPVFALGIMLLRN